MIQSLRWRKNENIHPFQQIICTFAVTVRTRRPNDTCSLATWKSIPKTVPSSAPSAITDSKHGHRSRIMSTHTPERSRTNASTATTVSRLPAKWCATSATSTRTRNRTNAPSAITPVWSWASWSVTSDVTRANDRSSVHTVPMLRPTRSN